LKRLTETCRQGHIWKMPLPTAWSDFSPILVLHFAFHSNLQHCGI
jgi:hypothetical protein